MNMVRRSTTVRMFLLAGVVWAAGCAGQESRSSVPHDVVTLQIHIVGDQRQFHVGELIPIEYEYTAVPGRFIYLVNGFQALDGGRGFSVDCGPDVELEADIADRRRRASEKFGEMLVDPLCQGMGIGGGLGGGSANGETQLSNEPLHFVDQLNRLVRFRRPGKYSCVASTSQITTAPRNEKFRPALRVSSNQLNVTLIEDPAWSRSTVLGLAALYEKTCPNKSPRDLLTQCWDLSARLNYLDTPESLAAKIRFFDGGQHGWENGFWDSINTSANREEALRLMTRRIQDPEVEVSQAVLNSLIAWDLEAESPAAFEPGTPSYEYHARAIELTRKYVQLLGSSLRTKAPNALVESAKTYEALAERRSCDGTPLISDSERDAVLAITHNRER